MPLRPRNQFVIKTCSAERTHVLPLFVHIRECDLAHFQAQERDGVDVVGALLAVLDADADFKKLVQDLDNVRGIDELIKSRGGGYASGAAVPAHQRAHPTMTLQWWLDDHPHGLLNVLQLTRTPQRDQYFVRNQPHGAKSSRAEDDSAEDEEYKGGMFRPLPVRKAAIVAWIYPPHVKIPPTGDQNIQVLVRIRPLIDREQSLLPSLSASAAPSGPSLRPLDDRTIEVRTADSTIKCSYDAVLDPSVTQEQVYDRVRECVQSFLQGFNATLFAYGQTGSGKSFTMFGSEADVSRFRPGLQKSQAGIIPRAVKEIFEGVVQLAAQASTGASPPLVYCSFVQIYNEQIFDLLRDSEMTRPLEIHEDRTLGIFVDGLSEYAVRSVGDCLALLQCGEQHRAVRSTHMNHVSSRSHSVFQLQLEQRRASDGATLKSKLNLVDLAGSEKWNFGADMQSHHIAEMTNINLSLHTLGRCIAALSTASQQQQQQHIPYRDSKLTRLLQDSLGGNTKTKIIATLSPSLDCLDESVSTLKFADRAKQVMVTVRINETRQIDPAYVERLEDEVQRLREVVRALQDGDERPERPKNPEEPYEEEDNAEESHGRGGRLKVQIAKLMQENLTLREQVERQQKESEQLRLRLLTGNSSASDGGGGGGGGGGGAPGSAAEANLLLAKQQLETTLRHLKEASDRFFKFEIEEEELRAIHDRLFKGQDNTNSKQPVDPEKELELSRKAIEKQQKLQNWLIEKEKRELLRLQQEQDWMDEQRRLTAERDAKFFKHAQATKRKLQLLAAKQQSHAMSDAAGDTRTMSAVAPEKGIASPDDVYEIQFDRDKGYNYMCCSMCWVLPLASSCLCLPCLPFIPCWARKEINSIQCKVTDRRIEYQGGYLNRVSKQIPLDRVQDVAVNEGCCQRLFGVKSLDVQTAGSAAPVAELSLNAPKDAEMPSQTMSAQGDKAVVSGSGDVVVEIDRDAGYKYACASMCCMLPLMSSCVCLPCVLCVPCWMRREIDSVECKVTDRRIEYDGGYLNRVSKKVPLDRVQDVAVTQGCCQRMYGVKSLEVQTAGSAAPTAEIVITAPKDAEMVRDLILQRRDQLVLGPGASSTAAGGGLDDIRKGTATNTTSAYVAMRSPVSSSSNNNNNHNNSHHCGSSVDSALVAEIRELKDAVLRIENRVNEGVERLKG
ncbi:hypothetical protein P43SY_004969 [Pythium insidiosum]|uniref:Kinesin motor domain-containing protein n=1 Tax=Pythium insidiosum TaxID=114742 RepID=A0AAD5QDV2_PYTIN|nr:hypothetical protein P43SY_004969 [Pythium insidiosum]